MLWYLIPKVFFSGLWIKLKATHIIFTWSKLIDTGL